MIFRKSIEDDLWKMCIWFFWWDCKRGDRWFLEVFWWILKWLYSLENEKETIFLGPLVKIKSSICSHRLLLTNAVCECCSQVHFKMYNFLGLFLQTELVERSITYVKTKKINYFFCSEVKIIIDVSELFSSLTLGQMKSLKSEDPFSVQLL